MANFIKAPNGVPIFQNDLFNNSSAMWDQLNGSQGIFTADPTTTKYFDVGYDRPVYTIPAHNSYVGYDRPAYTQPTEEQVANSVPHMSAEELATGIVAGKFGNGAARRAQLAQMGYSPEEIAAAQQIINQRLRSSRVPNGRRSLDVVIANKPVADSVPGAALAYQQGLPVQSEFNPSGYAKGHETYYDPRKGFQYR